jgi:hypothetical protein
MCPPGKELNPKTRRCVLECKSGYSRDLNFKCKKQNTRKRCPNKKQMNPYTKKCVDKCKEGYRRNKKFECIEKKTRKKR